MSNIKEIVCLANSRKLSGRCVAGKTLGGKAVGAWIRPVSGRTHEEVSYEERQYRDGSEPALLDIIKIGFVDARPRGHQRENYLLNGEYYWEKTGRLEWDDLARLVDDVDMLWVKDDSTYHGLHDRVDLGQVKKFDYSLLLVYVDAISVSVFAPREGFGDPKRRVQAEFSYGNVLYRFWVTDPVIESKYLAKKNGEFELGEA